MAQLNVMASVTLAAVLLALSSHSSFYGNDMRIVLAIVGIALALMLIINACVVIRARRSR